MENPDAPSPILPRLTGVLTFVTAAISVVLVVAVDNHAYGATGLALFACLAGVFFILELRFARDLGRYQALTSVSGLVGPAEQFLGSLMDPDTMLPRFWLFSARMTEEIQRAERHKRTLTLCALEPDDLTIYLDQSFRCKVGRAARGHLRASDSATVDHSGRLLVLFAETSGPEGEVAARRLVTTINSLLFENEPRRWRAAMVFFPEDGTNGDELLHRIDVLLAKRYAA